MAVSNESTIVSAVRGSIFLEMMDVRHINNNILLIVAVQEANAKCQLATTHVCSVESGNLGLDAHLLRDIENCQ